MTQSNQSINRRTCLKLSLVALATTELGGDGTTFAADDASTRQVGRHIYKSLKWGMIRVDGSVLEKFLLLKELGYDGVEIDSPGGVDKQEALDASRTTELPIEGVVNSTHWNVRHSDPDPSVRAEALENMRTAMRDAKLVDADSVLLVPGKVTDRGTRESRPSLGTIHSGDPQASAAGRGAKDSDSDRKCGATGFCYDPRQLANYIDEIDSPWVGVHFDIGNHIWVSPPAEWIRVLGSRIKKLDAKDRTRNRQRTKIGDGDADWPAVRAALSEIKYSGWVAAEGQRRRS